MIWGMEVGRWATRGGGRLGMGWMDEIERKRNYAPSGMKSIKDRDIVTVLLHVVTTYI